MGGLLCRKYLENFDFLQIPAGGNLDAAIFTGVRGQYCSSNQLPCCLFLDVIICWNRSRKQNLSDEEAIEEIVVALVANNNWTLQRTQIQLRNCLYPPNFFE